MKNKKRIIIPLIVCLVIAAAILLFFVFSKDNISPGRTGPAQKPPGTDGETAEAEVKTVTEWYEAVGTVKPRSKARIEARISGTVTDVRVNAGDKVAKGDLLLSLDGRQMRAQLAQAAQSLESAASQKKQAQETINSAEAAFAEAESAYNRTRKFFDAEAATEQDLEQARSRYLQAKAALKRAEDALAGASAGVRMAEGLVREAKIGLSYTKINAPTDGKVLKRFVDPGDMAMPGKPLLLLKTPGGLQLEAYVRESLVRKIHPGKTLRAELSTLQKTVDSRVEELIPYADPQTRTFLVKSKLPNIPGLYPGMYGKLRIPYKQVELVLIPRTAVYEVGQLELVMVKSADGWGRRYIKTGNIYGNRVEVLSGLSGDETLKIKEPGDGE